MASDFLKPLVSTKKGSLFTNFGQITLTDTENTLNKGLLNTRLSNKLSYWTINLKSSPLYGIVSRFFFREKSDTKRTSSVTRDTSLYLVKDIDQTQPNGPGKYRK